MKKLSLKLKKMMAMILKVISIIISSFGGLVMLGFITFMVYLIATCTHSWFFEISDNTRLFAMEWMAIASTIILIGMLGLSKAENVLTKIRWKTQKMC